MNTYMSDVVLPAGFIVWQPTDPRLVANLTHFVESGSYGPGWEPKERNHTIETVISKQEAQAEYSLSMVFGEFPSWVDTNYVYE